MKDGSLSADSLRIDRCARIHVRPVMQQQLDCLKIAIFRRYMQQRCSFQREGTPASRAKVKLWKLPRNQHRISSKLLR